MKFISVVSGFVDTSERDSVHLVRSEWDDWYQFSTLYSVRYVDSRGEVHHIGRTKIGQYGLLPGGAGEEVKGVRRVPDIPNRFVTLPDSAFSLGQDASYYENLTKIGPEVRERVLAGLKDLAWDTKNIDRASREEVTKISLLREVPLLTLKEQFSRLARGGVKNTSFELNYVMSYAENKPAISFKVEPHVTPPSNIHVIVGRNGTGKSTFLRYVAEHHLMQAIPMDDEAAVTAQISNLVSVSFSSFDEFEPLPFLRGVVGLSFHYIGLKSATSTQEFQDDIEAEGAEESGLKVELRKSMRLCMGSERRHRLIKAFQVLESDPIFASNSFADAVRAGHHGDQSAVEYVTNMFTELSSGHKIVLLTVTRLVEAISEKSLVLIDEPESHLHPPLLSAFVRALSDLLIDQNGLAIVATHSPVVLQEVPRSCVWKLNRVGDFVRVERPTLETFGESVGVLTSEVFGLEVTSSGYHGILFEVARRHASHGYEAALGSLKGQLGAEGRSILRSMVDALRLDQHVES